MITLTNLEQWCVETSKHAEIVVEKWKKVLANNPAYAFGWAGSAMTAAADMEVAAQIAGWIANWKENVKNGTAAGSDPEDCVKSIHGEVRGEVFRKAKWPEHSTSAVSNEMSLLRNSSLANLLERIER